MKLFSKILKIYIVRRESAHVVVVIAMENEKYRTEFNTDKAVSPNSPIDLKGQSNEIFDPQFFSSFEPVWVTNQWVKIFLILVEILLRYSNFSVEKSDSPGYHTQGRLTCRGIIPRWVMFWRIFY